MAGPTLSAAEVAEELGRSTGWLYEHWRTLAKQQRFPHPLLGGATPLTWSRAQVYAWLDRDLSRDQRIAAAAIRAAEAAAAGVRHVTRDETQVADDRAALDRQFASQTVEPA